MPTFKTVNRPVVSSLRNLRLAASTARGSASIAITLNHQYALFRRSRNSLPLISSTAELYTATADPATKVLLPQYATHSDPNGIPDFLHVGQAGAEAEARTLDVNFFAPTEQHSRLSQR